MNILKTLMLIVAIVLIFWMIAVFLSGILGVFT